MINRILIAVIILIYILVIFLDYYVYALVVNIFYLNTLLTVSLFAFLILDSVNIKKYIFFYCLKCIPIIAFIITCLIIFPRFTYKESQNIILNNYEKVSDSYVITKVSPKKVRVTKPPGIFVNYCYLLSLKTSNEIKYFVFNPLNGEFVETQYK